MPGVIQNLALEAKKNRFSSIPKLSEDDIISVWESVSEFIEAQMQGQKGVHIANLGTFTFIHKKMDIGNNKFILIQRPVFVLSEKFAQTHALHYAKYPTTGEIPVVQLNFTVLAMESPFDRDTVESCVREVLQALSRAVASQQNVEFLFRGIGVLNIRDSKVKMKFFKDFLNSMDGSGNLVRVLANRPGTADSVMSTQTSLYGWDRPATNTLVLPRLNHKKDLLPPITEHQAEDEDKNHEGKNSAVVTRMSNREAMHPHPVVGVSLTVDELDGVMTPRDVARGSSFKKLVTPPLTPTKAKAEPAKNDTTSPRQQRETDQESPRSDAALQTPEPRLNLPPPSLSPSSTVCASPAHHHRAGQELCYLCMQRAMRNIPVSFEEERKRKEKEQDALLTQYQQLKDQEAILKEQASNTLARHSNQKIAAFNLGVAECLRDVKSKRSSDFVKSYLFQNRPLTPLRFYKQDEYSKALEEQVTLKKTRSIQERHDREFIERLEQVQLAEDLAAQREQYMKAKSDQVLQYQRALSAQVRTKPLPLPKAEPDSKAPVFGRYDATNEKLLEQRERARALYRNQIDMVADKKKEMILKHLTRQKEEIEMLKRTKHELIEDRINSHNRSFDKRRSLEENWKVHARNKQLKEQEERKLMKTPGMLVLEQTEKYNRCGQCERRVANCGESNIWSESRYIPGSRLMV